MLDVALGTEKRKELWERQSKEESAGKLEVGGKGVAGGGSWDFLPQSWGHGEPAQGMGR